MINKFKNSIVIMMTPYVDYGCFSKAVNLGANDYILKPFKMESLIQKISIFQKKKEIEIREKRLAKFITTVLKEDKNLTFDFDITLPVIICSNLKKNVDLYVFSYSRYLNIDFEIICFDDLQKYKNTDSNLILYLRDYSTLTKKEQKLTLEITKNMNIIIFSNIDETAHGFHNITIKAGSEKINFDKILTINDYIQEVIIQNQDSFPDTELSKALGISRKSLWEKRKKFDIHKERKLKRINDK
jgi:DNA-binding NtrC family response regulator